ncbi:MAG: acyltransferase [Spirochaetes bacterium]|nr:MAG: acyltransferase [Spirochaetota bacterium]
MNILIVAVLLSAFSLWEVFLLLSMVFAPREATARLIFVYDRKAIALIFSMFRTYRGFKVKVEKRLSVPLPERFIVVANHQSLLDIPILMDYLPRGKHARFVAKKELAFGIPLISLLLRSGGHCLVKRRGDALHAMRSISAMARRCAWEGTIPVIFPEGTRSRTGALGTFHSAGYRKILEVAPLPILVVALEGGWRVVTLRDFFSNFGRLPYKVRFIEVLPAPQGKKEALASLAKARDMIESALGDMRG